MSLSTRDATRIAHEWLDQQEDLPTGRFTYARKYDAQVGGRMFTVMLKEPSRGKNFLLIELYVCDDGSVQVRRDRRAHVRQLFAEQEIVIDDVSPVVYDHPTAIARFLEALSVRTETTPSWLKDVEGVNNPTWNGSADAHARMEPLDSTNVVEVPVKVVLSKTGKANHNGQLSVRKQERKVVMVVTPEHVAEQIREKFYHYLNEMRTKRIYR